MYSLAGLNVDKLGQPLRANTAAFIRLIPGVSGGRIDGIRSVQPLQCVLLFLKLLPPPRA